jgi:hypothetical protein
LNNRAELLKSLQGADAQGREQIRAKLKENREQFLAQQRDSRADLRKNIQELKETLVDHGDVLDHAKEHGNNIADMVETNGFYVQASERGQIYTSDDFETWRPHQSHTTNALRAVTLFGNRIVAVGENGTVVYGDTADRHHSHQSRWDQLDQTRDPDQFVPLLRRIFSGWSGCGWQRGNHPHKS